MEKQKKKSKCQECNTRTHIVKINNIPFCMSCIPQEHRNKTFFKRMELKIINDIYKEIKPIYNKIMIIHDSVYGDKKQRPDLRIMYLKTMIFIEIDEKQHFNKSNLQNDLIRIKTLSDYAKKDKNKVRVIRIIPDEDKKESMFDTRSMYKTIYINDTNYSSVMNHIIKRIKVILRQAEEDSLLKKEKVSPIKLSPISPETESHRPKTISEAKLYEEHREKRRINEVSNKIKLKIDTSKALSKLTKMNIASTKSSTSKSSSRSTSSNSSSSRSNSFSTPSKSKSSNSSNSSSPKRSTSPKSTSPKKSKSKSPKKSPSTSPKKYNPKNMSVSDMRSLCKKLGLVIYGSRTQLENRILNKN